VAPASLTSPSLEPFLESLAGAADTALAGAAEPIERDYQLGSCAARIRLSRPQLEPLVTALAHLPQARGDAPGLTIDAWDGSPILDGPWRGSTGTASGAVRGLAGDRAGWFLSFDGAITALDLDRHRGYYWRDDASRQPWRERAAPFSPVLGGWLAEHGIQLVHAAAVGSDHGCVLVAGGSGAGKSHIALACLQAGIGLLGDDTCLLSGEDSPAVWSIYNCAQPAPSTIELLDGLPQMPGERVRLGKALWFVHDNLVLSAPLRAIAIARRGIGASTQVRPASGAQALAALASSSLLQLPGAGGAMLRRLSEVVQAVRCVELEAGEDPSELAAAVGALL
jgi:hypothetical protein